MRYYFTFCISRPNYFVQIKTIDKFYLQSWIVHLQKQLTKLGLSFGPKKLEMKYFLSFF